VPGGSALRYQAGRAILFLQFVILFVFLSLTIGNEVLDGPHYLLGDTPTSFGQRTGEMAIEILIFVVVVGIEFVVINNLLKRIRILEGFLPICANCKKIRHEDQWEQIEEYITDHSLAKFSHSICPDCVKKLYPDLYPSAGSRGKKGTTVT
jgi:hypothetical protein